MDLPIQHPLAVTADSAPAAPEDNFTLYASAYPPDVVFNISVGSGQKIWFKGVHPGDKWITKPDIGYCGPLGYGLGGADPGNLCPAADAGALIIFCKNGDNIFWSDFFGSGHEWHNNSANLMFFNFGANDHLNRDAYADNGGFIRFSYGIADINP